MGLPFRTGQLVDAIFTDTSNNVGIGGAPSGSYKFEVTGTAKVSGASTFSTTIAAGSNSTNNTATFTTYDGGTGLQLIGSTGNLVFVPLFSPTVGARINAINTAGSAYLPLTMNASVFYCLSGNVMIGSTSDSGYKLDVTGTGRFSGNVILSSGSGNKIVKLGGSPTASDGASLEFIPSNNTTNWAIRTNWNVGGALEFSPSSAAGGSTFATPSMLITSGGNVGIGTTSPQRPLHVKGVFEVEDGSSSNYSLIYQSSQALAIETENATAITLNTNATERMRITSGGEVGIGVTPSSGNKFMVKGSSASSGDTSILIQNSAGTNLFYVRNDAAVFLLNGYAFTTASAANMYLDSSGVIQKSVSSIKYKENINNYNKGLDIILKLRPVEFTSKNSITDKNKKFAGLIAEEIHDLGLEEFVIYAEDGSPDALAYQNMVALLVKGMQEQNQLIQQLRTDIELIKNK